MGLNTIQSVLEGRIGLFKSLIYLVGKIMATAFTVGSGGSAGLFAGPGLFIGTMIGSSLSLIFKYSISTLLVLCGMFGTVSSALLTPLAFVALSIEIFRGIAAVPAAFGSLLGYAVGLGIIRLSQKLKIAKRKISANIELVPTKKS